MNQIWNFIKSDEEPNGDRIIQHREELKNAITKMIEMKEHLKHD